MIKLFFALVLLTVPYASIVNAEAIKVIELQHRTAEEVTALIRPLLDPRDRVIANANSLIIKASPDRLITLQQLVAQLDTPIQNLVITVVQDQHSTAESLNAQARVRLSGQHSKHATSVRGHIRGRLFQNQGTNKISNSQTIRTLEGQAAHIAMGKAHPIKRTSIHNPRYGYPEVSTRTDYIEASTGFAVTPRLAGTNQVIIDVAPWSDRFNHYGGINTQGAQTTLRVNLGEWVAIGGINQTSQRQQSGISSHGYSDQSNRLHILIKVDKSP